MKALLDSGYDDLEEADGNAPSDKKRMLPAEPRNPSKGGIVIGMKREGDCERIYYVGEDSHLLCIISSLNANLKHKS